MNYSLHKLLKISRGRFRHLPSIGPINPPHPTNPPVDPPPASGYTESDFGNNAINNHYASAAQHSGICQTILIVTGKQIGRAHV